MPQEGLRIRGRERHLHGDLVLAVLRCHLRRQLHGAVRVGDVEHDRRAGEIAHRNFVARAPGELQMVRIRDVAVRIRDADVVDQTGVVVAILRGQRDGVAPRLQYTRRNVDAQRPFVLAGKGHVAKVRSVQRNGHIVREANDHALQRDLQPSRLCRSRIEVRGSQHLIDRSRGDECAEEVFPVGCDEGREVHRMLLQFHGGRVVGRRLVRT